MYHGHYRSLIYKCLAGLLEAGVELLRDRPWGVGWRCLSGSGRGAVPTRRTALRYYYACAAAFTGPGM
jgi:hypothetical protein